MGLELVYQGRIDVDSTSLSNIDLVLERNKYIAVAKRFFSIILSCLGLIALALVFLLIGYAIKSDSRGPIIFRQDRVGRNGRIFQILKFRTMVHETESKGLQITVANDFRITKVGRLLRKYKLDELPQLINVLKGDMSFVGPRPEVPKYVALYNETQRNILKVRPGITDPASIEYRDESKILAMSDDPERTYIEEIMPKKFELSAEYLRNASLKSDMELIIKTVVLAIR